MKKAVLVLGLILALGLVGCGTKKPAADSQSNPDEAKTEEISGSLGELLGKNSNLKCTVKETEGQAVTSSTTYIAGKKARNDAQVKNANGETMVTHMIVNEEWLYSWNEQQANSAVKVKLADLNTSEFNDAQNAGQAGNFNSYQQKANYSCLPWSVDEKMFTPPADVNFVNFSDLFNQLPSLQGENGDKVGEDYSDNSSMCAQCDLIPDATAKSQCKSNLGCN